MLMLLLITTRNLCPPLQFWFCNMGVWLLMPPRLTDSSQRLSLFEKDEKYIEMVIQCIPAILRTYLTR
jgi:hypothetical protein